MVTPTAITAKARTATVIFAGLSVKRSSNSQTLGRHGASLCGDVRLHGVIDFADPGRVDEVHPLCENPMRTSPC
jgi:hypothetical protein